MMTGLERAARGIRATLLLAAALAVPAGAAFATPFAIVGPRAVGMGGAGVSATNDAHATYWNPAAMANRRGLDIRISGAVRWVNQTGIENRIDDIKKIDFSNLSQENIDRLKMLIESLDEDSSVQADGGGGGFVTFNWENNFFGFSFVDVASGTGNIPFLDTQIAIIGDRLVNNALVALNGLESREITLSYAYSLFQDVLALGVNVKVTQGVVYFDASTLADSETGLDFLKGYSKTNDDWEPSVDVGAIWNPTRWLRFGMVGKYLNRPTFDIFPDEDTLISKIQNRLPPGVQIPPQFLERVQRKLQLAPQGRASVSVFPIEGMTLSADADVTPNPTFVHDNDSQIISVGGEQLFFDRILAARLGVYYDFVAPNSNPVPSIGVGVEFAGFSFDLGGAYDFDKENAALGVGFGYHL